MVCRSQNVLDLGIYAIRTTEPSKKVDTNATLIEESFPRKYVCSFFKYAFYEKARLLTVVKSWSLVVHCHVRLRLRHPLLQKLQQEVEAEDLPSLHCSRRNPASSEARAEEAPRSYPCRGIRTDLFASPWPQLDTTG